MSVTSRCGERLADHNIPISLHTSVTKGLTLMQQADPTPSKAIFQSLPPIHMAELVSSWILGGMLPRNPDLNLVLVESGIGWIAYYLERLQHEFRRHNWVARGVIDELPEHLLEQAVPRHVRGRLGGFEDSRPTGCRQCDVGEATTPTLTQLGRSRRRLSKRTSAKLASEDKERKGKERYRLPRALPSREVLRDASYFGPLCSHDPLGRILSASLLARAPTSQRRAAADKRRVR